MKYDEIKTNLTYI